jgi:hypothetical protein
MAHMPGNISRPARMRRHCSGEIRTVTMVSLAAP